MSPARRTSGGPPKPCRSCSERVVAWTNPRVDFCYECLPGGPFAPPPCRGCGNNEDYYSQGLCGRCHHYAPQHVESCNHCLAWGVIRKYKWLCWRCTSWRARFPRGTCRSCRRENLPVNPAQLCNLCDRQTAIALGATVEEATADGQQLYLANIAWAPARRRHGTRRQPRKPTGTRRRRDAPVVWFPREDHQLTLFEMPRDLVAAQAKVDLEGGFPEPPDQQMAAFLDYQVRDHARRHGWPKSTIMRTQKSMRVLQLMQDTPGTILLASDAMQLQQIGLTAIPVIAVATAAGVMLDDREPALHAWVTKTIADLPDPMQVELREWFDIMANGSTTTPRRQPRSEQSIRLALRWAMPALTTWATQGHTSLREITRDDVVAVLPPSGNPRSTMGAGLRSIFTLLKARKTLFLNPTARVLTGSHERRDPLPVPAERIRAALNSPNPAGAALTALAAFHGLRAGDLRNMQLTDLVDGRLRLRKRTVVLAEPVRVRLAAWLNYRNRRWPNTANPHVFLNHRNAGHTIRVGGRWLTIVTGIPIQILREDRILHEAEATHGDIRRICDLFGLTVEGALRYLPGPDFTDLDDTA